MEANSVSNVLYTKYGKKWHFITPDYAFGHTLYQACTDDLKKLGLLRVNSVKKIWDVNPAGGGPIVDPPLHAGDGR